MYIFVHVYAGAEAEDVGFPRNWSYRAWERPGVGVENGARMVPCKSSVLSSRLGHHPSS